MAQTLEEQKGIFSEIKFRAPYKNAKGYVFSNFDYKREPITFQTTRHDDLWSRSQFGFNVFTKDLTEDAKRQKENGSRQNLDYTVGEETIEALRELEALILKTAIERADVWFKDEEPKNRTPEVIASKFTSVIHESASHGTTIRTKVNCDDDKRNAVVIEQMRMPTEDDPSTVRTVDPNELKDPENMPFEFLGIVQTSGLWFQKKTFGLNLTTIKMLLAPKTTAKTMSFNLGAPPTLPPPPAQLALPAPSYEAPPSESVLFQADSANDDEEEVVQPAPKRQRGEEEVPPSESAPKRRNDDEGEEAQPAPKRQRGEEPADAE